MASLTPSDATRLMLAFCRQVRADGCSFDLDGDMVLFQWGAYDFGEGETCRYNLARQFIAADPPDEEDDETDPLDCQEMSQLSLTVQFAVTDRLRAIKPGNRWCSLPAEADEFEQFIASQEVTAAVSTLSPLRTTLGWSPA